MSSTNPASANVDSRLGCQRLNGQVQFLRDFGTYISPVKAIKFIDPYHAIATLTVDSYIVIWTLRRDNQYFPSISYLLRSEGLCMGVMDAGRRLYTGLMDGSVSVIALSPDLNFVTFETYICEHTPMTRVLVIHCNEMGGFLISGNEQGEIICYTVHGNKTYFKHNFGTAPIAIESDSSNQRIFLAGAKQISVLNYKNTNGMISVFPSHILGTHFKLSSSITFMTWYDQWQTLVAGSTGGKIMMWCYEKNTENRKIYNFNFHTNSIVHIKILPNYKQMVSLDSSGTLVTWDLSLKREEVVEWKCLNSCEACECPFFWNFSQMMSKKCLGKRRHHCRNCGRSFCDSCCSHITHIPRKGEEIPTRVCSECFKNLENNPPENYAFKTNLQSSSMIVSFSEKYGNYVTCNYYFPLQLWHLAGFDTC